VRQKVYLEMQERLALPACNQRFGSKTIPFFQPLVVPDDASRSRLPSGTLIESGESDAADGASDSRSCPADRTYHYQGWYLPEDYAFCERARQCGYKIMADTTIRLWHHGSYGYSWEDAGKNQERYETFYFNVG
jgi:hypothetical protein